MARLRAAHEIAPMRPPDLELEQHGFLADAAEAALVGAAEVAYDAVELAIDPLKSILGLHIAGTGLVIAPPWSHK